MVDFRYADSAVKIPTSFVVLSTEPFSYYGNRLPGWNNIIIRFRFTISSPFLMADLYSIRIRRLYFAIKMEWTVRKKTALTKLNLRMWISFSTINDFSTSMAWCSYTYISEIETTKVDI